MKRTGFSAADIVVQGFRQKQELGTVMAGDMWHVAISTAARGAPESVAREFSHGLQELCSAPQRRGSPVGGSPTQIELSVSLVADKRLRRRWAGSGRSLVTKAT